MRLKQALQGGGRRRTRSQWVVLYRAYQSSRPDLDGR